MIPTGREVTVAAGLLQVMTPQQEELLVTVVPHTFVALKKIRKVSQVCEVTFFGAVSHICTHAFQVSPYTIAGAGFHYEANKGRAVSPEITQALTERQ